jgi:hypothetical protein
VGCSNYSGWHLMSALAPPSGTATALRQPADLLLAPGARRRVRARPISVPKASASWSGAARGWLLRASTARPVGPRGSRHLTDWNEPPVRDEAGCRTSSTRWSRSPAASTRRPQVALAWTLGAGVASLVIGARTDEQLADNLRPPTCSSSRRTGPARRAERAAAPLPVLAPGRERVGAPERSRPDAARPHLADADPTRGARGPTGGARAAAAVSYSSVRSTERVAKASSTSPPSRR